MKTIQTCVLLILLFAANTYSQDAVKSEIDKEAVTAKSSKTEDKIPERETNYLTTLPSQGTPASSPDKQTNEEEILNPIPEEHESKVIEPEPSTENPPETPDPIEEKSKGTVLSELEAKAPESTSEQIPLETANPENTTAQPIETTLDPEIEKESKDELSGANVTSDTLETETSKTEHPQTEAVVEEAKNTDSPATNNKPETETEIPSEVNTGASETETSKIEQPEIEAVVEGTKPTESPDTSETSKIEAEAVVEDTKTTESPASETEIPSEVNTETSKTEYPETEAAVEDTNTTESPAIDNESSTKTEETAPTDSELNIETTSKTEYPETEAAVEDANTTESPAIDNESSTKPEETAPTDSELNIETTSKIEYPETEAAVEDTNTTESPAIDNESLTKPEETAPTDSELNIETTSISSNPSPTFTEEVNQVTAETSSDPIEVSPTTTTPCTEVGNFARPTNCRQYLSCSGNTTNLISQDCKCPERTAFNSFLGRCTRDLSPCVDEEPVCLRASSIPNPNGENSSYFWCVPSLLGGFHKYQIQCSKNEVFIPLFGRCWLQNPLDVLGLGLINREPSDREIVRAEWKLLRKEIKQKIKAEKQQKKMEDKVKARAEKLAAKELLKKEKELARKVDDEDDEQEEDD